MTDPTPTNLTRLRTGVAGLDELLGGGLLPGRTVLLKGAPGTGKTTLGLQMLVAGARDFDVPGILLSFEQAPEQLHADAAAFGWDLKDLADRGRLHVLFVQPDEILEKPGRQENRLLVTIADLVDDFGARRVLIDSVSHLRPLFTGEDARPLFMKFLLQLKAMGLTPFMTAELESTGAPAEGLLGLDAYLADTVVYLERHTGESGRPGRRTIEVVKTRGFQALAGRHPFEIESDGLRVYPRTMPMEVKSTGIQPNWIDDRQTVTDCQPLSTGIHGLDPLLGGGYLPGSRILVAGLSGTFKSTLAAHFVLGAPGAGPSSEGGAAGGADGETAGAIWLSFHESADKLIRSLAGRGFDPAAALAGGRLKILECQPGREPIEKILARVEKVMEAEPPAIAPRGIWRVVIDGMNELVAGEGGDDAHSEGARNESARGEAAAWFLRRLEARGATVLVTQRLARVVGQNPLSEIAGAELADTIVYLGLVEIESRLEKVISVLKHRGGPAEGDLRAIEYRPRRGLCVSQRFHGLSGILQGAPAGRRKGQIEQIFQPLYFIRDFLTLAQDETVDEVRRRTVLQNLSRETGSLIERLAKHFDITTLPESAAVQEAGKKQ